MTAVATAEREEPTRGEPGRGDGRISHPVMVRVDPGALERARLLAYRRGLSLAAVVGLLVEAGVDDALAATAPTAVEGD